MSSSSKPFDLDRDEAVKNAAELLEQISLDPSINFGLYVFDTGAKGGVRTRAYFDLDETRMLILSLQVLKQVEDVILEKDCPCLKCDTRLIAIGQAIHVLSTLFSDNPPASQVSH